MGPCRPRWLRAQAWKSRGTLVNAGAFTDPIDSAILIFDATPAEVEAFAAEDPCTYAPFLGWTVFADFCVLLLININAAYIVLQM